MDTKSGHFSWDPFSSFKSIASLSPLWHLAQLYSSEAGTFHCEDPSHPWWGLFPRVVLDVCGYREWDCLPGFFSPCVCHLYIRRLLISCFNFVASHFTESIYQLKEVLLHSLASLWYRGDVSYFIYLLICVFSMETTFHCSHLAFLILRNCELMGVSLIAVLVSVLLLRWNRVTKSNLGNKVFISASMSWSQVFIKEEGQEFTAGTGNKGAKAEVMKWWPLLACSLGPTQPVFSWYLEPSVKGVIPLPMSWAFPTSTLSMTMYHKDAHGPI